MHAWLFLSLRPQTIFIKITFMIIFILYSITFLFCIIRENTWIFFNIFYFVNIVLFFQISLFIDSLCGCVHIVSTSYIILICCSIINEYTWLNIVSLLYYLVFESKFFSNLFFNIVYLKKLYVFDLFAVVAWSKRMIQF